MVATCCLAEWGRVVQPGARNERFWRAYALMPVYECTGDGHSNQGLPDDAGLLGQLRAESERLREQWPVNANANGGLATGEAGDGCSGPRKIIEAAPVPATARGGAVS